MWTKNGIPVTTSERLQLSASRDKLYLVNADPSDTAQYICTAKNSAGEDQAVFDTTVNGTLTRGFVVLVDRPNE